MPFLLKKQKWQIIKTGSRHHMSSLYLSLEDSLSLSLSTPRILEQKWTTGPPLLHTLTGRHINLHSPIARPNSGARKVTKPEGLVRLGPYPWWCALRRWVAHCQTTTLSQCSSRLQSPPVQASTADNPLVTRAQTADALPSAYYPTQVRFSLFNFTFTFHKPIANSQLLVLLGILLF